MSNLHFVAKKVKVVCLVIYSFFQIIEKSQLTLVTRSNKTCLMATTLSYMEGHAVVLQEAFASLTGRAGGLQVQTCLLYTSPSPRDS